MGKIWIKSTDPNRQCCGCEGKTSPCDSCCPINTMSSGENVYPLSGQTFIDKFRYVLPTPPNGLAVTDASLTPSLSGSLLSIENDRDYSASSAGCTLASTSNNNGRYSLLFTIKSGEQIRFTSTILDTVDSEGTIYYDPADVSFGRLCTPPFGIPVQPIGVYRAQDAGSITIFAGDNGSSTGVYTQNGVKVTGQILTQYSIEASGVASGAPVVTNEDTRLMSIQSPDGTCVIRPATRIEIPSYTLLNQVTETFITTNPSTGSSFFSSTSMNYTVASTMLERSYTVRMATGGCNLPLTDAAAMAIGETAYHQIQIGRIVRVKRAPGRAAFETKAVKAACVNVSTNNLSSIQLFNVSGAPISLQSRLRKYVLTA